HQGVVGELTRLTEAGIKMYFIHGNRDFHVDGSFQRRTGVRVLGDSAEVNIAGRRALLMHGDMLCADDMHYHSYRRFARSPVGRSLFKALPIAARRLLAKCMTRASSIGERSGETGAQWSISEREVMAVFQAGYDMLVCGHVHIPGVHRWTVNGVEKVLYVLGDWDDHGTYLECDKETLRMKDAFGDR
ncbi:MAG: UDP-2,3-diacylglucosamine diphosphatase, partial [Planctomycetota bacterium]|nr:UDP-2,3-diacylglucosamine diphosphatase [Planctomycetota bacterium]